MITLSSPCQVGQESTYMADALARKHTAGCGHYTRRCEDLLQKQLEVPRVILTTSGTHALEMCAALLPGATIGGSAVMPTFTFSSTANAFMNRFIPRFCDISPDTLNMDLTDYQWIGDELVMVPVHYAGVSCDMDALGKVAAVRGLKIIEDAAHALFGKYRGRNLGTFGPLAALSFHETKNFQCGEGGALIVNDAKLIPMAEQVRDKGTNMAAMSRCEVDRYVWTEWGSSYCLSEILAAHLLAQLETREKVMRRRMAVWSQYDHWLSNIPGVRVPTVPENCYSSHHIFYLLLPDQKTRDRMIGALKAKGVNAAFHYVPLHESPMGAKLGYKLGDFPVAERISRTMLRLPIHYDMTRLDVERVVDAVREFKA